MTVDRLDLRVQLARITGGYRPALAVYAAAKLGLADAMGAIDHDADALAAAIGVQSPALRRLLRLLVGLGILREAALGRYALTPLGALLRSDVPGSALDGVIVTCEMELPAWQRLAEGIRRGVTPFELAFGSEFFEHLRKPQNGELAERFDGFMSGLTTWQASALVEAYDFSDVRLLVDVGGGDGTLLAAILRANPRLRGILFDLPDVVARARAKLAAAGVADRCAAAGGSFFDAVPGGGDLYLLKWIIHDWDDERSKAILARCREAIAPDGRLVLYERLIPSGPAMTSDEYLAVTIADVHMFANPGGRERTIEEFTELLGAAGFRLVRVLPTRALNVIEAAPGPQ